MKFLDFFELTKSFNSFRSLRLRHIGFQQNILIFINLVCILEMRSCCVAITRLVMLLSLITFSVSDEK